MLLGLGSGILGQCVSELLAKHSISRYHQWNFVPSLGAEMVSRLIDPALSRAPFWTAVHCGAS